MQRFITVPIDEDQLEEVIELIQQRLSDDEAGPAFFIATAKWKKENNYEELPF